MLHLKQSAMCTYVFLIEINQLCVEFDVGCFSFSMDQFHFGRMKSLCLLSIKLFIQVYISMCNVKNMLLK